jgi:hypothetical protein
METSTSQDKPQASLQADVSLQRMWTLHGQERYQESLDICLEIVRTHPEITEAWTTAARNCAQLARYRDAIRYAQTALAHGENISGLAILAHAFGALEQWGEVRRYGLQALNMLYAQFSNTEPIIPQPNLPQLPPPPSVQTREHNIIAFSLFGHDSKYCETAILNVHDQPHVYPYWVCRFYVDDSVSVNVIDRLQAGGAQIVKIEGFGAQCPGEMWRFFSLDDPQAHRILFRDADSLISPREAAAVEQWISSGKLFHMMHDDGSHIDLIMPGLWGTVAGSVPSLNELIKHFLNTPIKSALARRSADQDFLRNYVWPYARTSLMRHDSVFGFMNAVPFPDHKRPDIFHTVGYPVGSFAFNVNVKHALPDDSPVNWSLYRVKKSLDAQPQEELVCSYVNVVYNGTLTVRIPMRYAQWLRQGTARIKLTGYKAI